MGVQEALYEIVDQVCQILECDWASVFMVDEINGQLWSKAAKGVDPIRIPITTGIVGHVVNSRKIMNIEDAYKESLFNRNVDIINNYRTKSILCVPIFD